MESRREQPSTSNQHRFVPTTGQYFGLGTDLNLLSPGEAFRERVTIRVPFELPAGNWTLWVGLSEEIGHVPMADGTSLVAAAVLNVREGTRELWALPRIHRFE